MVKEHVLALLSRENPDSRAYYSLVFEEQPEWKNLNYKIKGLYPQITELKDGTSTGTGEELSVLEYLQALFGHIQKSISEMEHKSLLSINDIFTVCTDTKSEYVGGKIVHIPRAVTGGAPGRFGVMSGHSKTSSRVSVFREIISNGNYNLQRS